MMKSYCIPRYGQMAPSNCGYVCPLLHKTYSHQFIVEYKDILIQELHS